MSLITESTRSDLAELAAREEQAFGDLMAVCREAGMDRKQIDRVIEAHVAATFSSGQAGWTRGFVLAGASAAESKAVAHELVAAGAR